jgi:hypothetical protein
MFCDASGSPILKPVFVPRMDAILNHVNHLHGTPVSTGAYKGQSLRRGGATSMALSGVPDRVIQAVGRWKSDAYKTYIESNGEELRTAHASATITRDADLYVGIGTGIPGWTNQEDKTSGVVEDRSPTQTLAQKQVSKRPVLKALRYLRLSPDTVKSYSLVVAL